MTARIHQLKTAYGGLVRTLHVDVGLCAAFDPENEKPPERALKFRALWDTGASNTVITERVVKSLQLPVLGVTEVYTAAGKGLATKHLVAVHLPGGVGFPSVAVTCGSLGPGADVLLGMDIIGAGDFCVTNHGGATHVHFQIPSQGIANIYKGMFASSSHGPAPTQAGPLIPKVGRNDPCPCGSGKKYKHCHGR